MVWTVAIVVEAARFAPVTCDLQGHFSKIQHMAQPELAKAGGILQLQRIALTV